jgi:hypothetical protein
MALVFGEVFVEGGVELGLDVVVGGVGPAGLAGPELVAILAVGGADDVLQRGAIGSCSVGRKEYAGTALAFRGADGDDVEGWREGSGGLGCRCLSAGEWGDQDERHSGEEQKGSAEGHWEEPRVENTITLLIDGAMATI